MLLSNLADFATEIYFGREKLEHSMSSPSIMLSQYVFFIFLFSSAAHEVSY